MNPFKDLNSTATGKAIANQYCKEQYALNTGNKRINKNLKDKAWRRRTGKVPLTHTKSEAEMIAEYIAKQKQLKDNQCNLQQ